MRTRIAGCVVMVAVMLMPHVTTAQESKTAKERSSRKWLDEQRVDNCRVPVELRGDKPRPGCQAEQSAASTQPR